MEKSILFNTDSYKCSHFLQYPEGTTEISSYIEPRGISKNFNFSHVMFFGLQMFLEEYLSKPITKEEIDLAEELWTQHGVPFNRKGWDYILEKHNGYLPIFIEALPEGSVHNISIPQVQVWNTDPNVPWLTSFVETALLRAVWYPSTVATLSWNLKQQIKKYLNKTCDDPETVLPFRLHDFGARGTSSLESAGIGGLAHLVNFMGTDTFSSIMYARKYYGLQTMPAYSIPASEHSTITTWGMDNEAKAYENMIDKFSGEGKIYACVSDSYDIYNAVSEIWGTQLKDKVISSGGTLVIRPDSGDPKTVVVKILNILSEKFGHTVNSKEYKVLHPSVRVIQGDGVNQQSINEILEAMMKSGYSAENIAFGMGGKLLQGIDRDTLAYAMKANQITINGEIKPVFKNPKTDSSKSSKAWKQKVTMVSLVEDDDFNVLEPVFLDGKILRYTSFEKIRKNSTMPLELKSSKSI